MGMESLKTGGADEREQARRELHRMADEAVELMFADDQQSALVTFTQRRERAVQLTSQMGVRLLERHLAADPQVRPPAEERPKCPKCGTEGRRAGEGGGGGGPPTPRTLTTETGEVRFAR